MTDSNSINDCSTVTAYREFLLAVYRGCCRRHRESGGLFPSREKLSGMYRALCWVWPMSRARLRAHYRGMARWARESKPDMAEYYESEIDRTYGPRLRDKAEVAV